MERDKDSVTDLLWIKRQAMQVVIQLPDDIDEALLVLAHAEVLVKQFLASKDETGADQANVVKLIR